jgi:hypothetical protein
METASGRYVDVRDPDPSTIHLDDIAHHLSRLCRYTGAVRVEHYSVAEHAVHVTRRLASMGASNRAQLAGLHHDDHEAYLGDIGRPHKALLQPVEDDLAERLDAVIRDALKLPDPFALNVHREIKDADNWALAMEAWHLLPSQGRGWWSEGLYDPLTPRSSLGLGANTARRLFLATHDHLMTAIAREALRAP